MTKMWPFKCMSDQAVAICTEEIGSEEDCLRNLDNGVRYELHYNLQYSNFFKRLCWSRFSHVLEPLQFREVLKKHIVMEYIFSELAALTLQEWTLP